MRGGLGIADHGCAGCKRSRGEFNILTVNCSLSSSDGGFFLEQKGAKMLLPEIIGLAELRLM